MPIVGSCPVWLSTRFQDLHVKILLLAGCGVVATLGAGGFELLQMRNALHDQASVDQQAAGRIFAAVVTEHLNTVRSLVVAESGIPAIRTSDHPEAFEAWVGERFREVGYEVQVTPPSGDHGIDLILTRDGEETIVQCMHHPLSTIGEPVLRDLFGAIHYIGANGAVLVTTVQLSNAARSWLVGKRIEVWVSPRIKDKCGEALAQLASQITQILCGPTPGR